MTKDIFITAKPTNPSLRKHISYFYFHVCREPGLEKNFIYYPGYKNALTIYQHSRVEYGHNYSIVSPSDNNVPSYVYLYSGMISSYRKATMKSPFDKIGIVFNELGINHFMNAPLSELTSDNPDKSFNYFHTEFKKILDEIYQTDNIEKKVRLLDHFFEKKYSDFEDPILKRCVHHIIKSGGKVKVQHLATKFGVSRRTLLRLFKKHLCCSVKSFIDVVQFRKSLDYFLNDQNINSLSELAHLLDYYDQPQYIHHFKKLAGINPTDFFREVEHLGNEDTYWTFV